MSLVSLLKIFITNYISQDLLVMQYMRVQFLLKKYPLLQANKSLNQESYSDLSEN